MLHRALDASYPVEVHQRITLLTAARTAANACFRFAPPFLATVASDLDVSFGTIGVAVAISELSGLFSPLTGSIAERLHRRTAMVIGLLGVALASVGAASSVHVAMLAVALIVLAQSKVMFDLGLGAWVSDRVAYERRGRVIGLTETSWALGLLVGVTTMGLITAVSSWRVAYVSGALVVLVLAASVWKAVEDDPVEHRDARAGMARSRVTRPMWILAAGGFCLMGASQMLFVTFGKWMRDEFDFTDGTVALVAFLLGFGELFASLAAARQADHWGKEISGTVGAAIMVPSAILLAIGEEQLAIGLPALIVAIAAFEFAIVSIIPLGTHLVPGAPAFGMAIMFAAGTSGRALASIPATTSYERSGMSAPALMAGVLALGTIVALMVIKRSGAVQR
ncbi:MAG TPA: MFS transporter [Ilumatobacteraceae bacterium]|nr:MFS transporter [Ilumatobacteraceae bacterium]